MISNLEKICIGDNVRIKNDLQTFNCVAEIKKTYKNSALVKLKDTGVLYYLPYSNMVKYNAER